MKKLIILSVTAFSLGGCWEKEPVKDKAYYHEHRDELEAENRRCRDSGQTMADEACRRIDVIRGEIFREDVGKQIKAQ